MFVKRTIRKGCNYQRWVTVEPIMLVYMFASFLSYPSFQQLLYSSVCSMTPNCTTTSTTNSSSSDCDNSSSPVTKQVRASVSHWILYNNLAASLPAIAMSLFYGSLSDKYGRRVFMILPAVSGILNAIIILTVSHYSPDKIYLYLIGSLLSGLSGGFSSFNFAVYSYISDISNIRYRTVKIGILESMMYLGGALSSFTSGVWIQNEGYSSPFWGVLACHVFVLIYTVIFLPLLAGKHSTTTTTTTDGLQSINSPSAFQLTTTGCVGRVVKFFSLVISSWKISLLFLIFFIVEVNFLGITDIVILYAINRLCWPSDYIGYFLGSKVMFNSLAALFLLPLLTLCHVTDSVIVLVGLISGIGALVTMGTAETTWMMLLAPVIGSLRGCVVPVLRSMLSKLTPAAQQGVMFSGISIMEAAAMLIASSFYNALFPVTYSIDPGFCFYLMILILLIPMGCTIILHFNPSNSCNVRDGSPDDEGEEVRKLIQT